MADVRNKLAIITGAGRRIGRGIAIAHGRAGAKVALSSRSKSTVDSVTGERKERYIIQAVANRISVGRHGDAIKERASLAILTGSSESDLCEVAL